MTEIKAKILVDGVEKAFEDNKWVTPVPHYRVQRMEYVMDVSADAIDPSDVGDLVEEIYFVADMMGAIDDMNLLIEKADEAVSAEEHDFLVNAIARCVRAKKYDAIPALLDF